MSNKNINLGKWGESIAADYIENNGYKILEKNFRTEYGEIDVIAEKEGVIVFVEVKTRTGKQYGHPEGAITPQKSLHMLESAQAYIQGHSDSAMEWRIDVIAIYKNKLGEYPKIAHFENAIQG